MIRNLRSIAQWRNSASTRLDVPTAVCLLLAVTIVCSLSRDASAQPANASEVRSAEHVASKPPSTSIRGSTYVALASGLERVFRGEEPQSLAELKLLEVQQSRVAEAIEEVTVNVQQGSAQGSGVLINEEGYVLTAAHVAGKPGLEATIVLNDGTRLQARTLGMNRNKDAGLVQIVAGADRKWPFATPGRSSELRIGEWVIAGGHPGGFNPERGSVIRVGRVQKVHRSRSDGKAHTLFTDCALIGGDSGGPLFTLEGKLIGIHSRIGTNIEDNMHVPIDVYSDDWDRLASGEAWGVLPGFRPVIGVSATRGEVRPIIAEVAPGGPAYRAGVAPGDRILTFNGVAISTFRELQLGVEGTMPGEVVVLTLQRGEQKLRVYVTVAAADY